MIPCGLSFIEIAEKSMLREQTSKWSLPGRATVPMGAGLSKGSNSNFWLSAISHWESYTFISFSNKSKLVLVTCDHDLIKILCLWDCTTIFGMQNKCKIFRNLGGAVAFIQDLLLFDTDVEVKSWLEISWCCDIVNFTLENNLLSRLSAGVWMLIWSDLAFSTLYSIEMHIFVVILQYDDTWPHKLQYKCTRNTLEVRGEHKWAALQLLMML